MSRKKAAVFTDLLRTHWPMAPDPEPPISRIRLADDLIDEASRKLAEMDRELARLRRLRLRSSQAAQAVQDQIVSVEAAFEAARRDLMDLIELAELPPELMGTT